MCYFYPLRAFGILIIVALNSQSDNSNMCDMSESGSEVYYVSSYHVFCLLVCLIFFLIARHDALSKRKYYK